MNDHGKNTIEYITLVDGTVIRKYDYILQKCDQFKKLGFNGVYPADIDCELDRILNHREVNSVLGQWCDKIFKDELIAPTPEKLHGIKELELEDFSGTIINQDPELTNQMPQPTPENMLILMNKINELTLKVNELSRPNFLQFNSPPE